MALIEVAEAPVDVEQQLADGLVAFTNQVNDEILRLYRMGKEMFWNRPDFTLANAQAVLDKLGPNALVIFGASAALGNLIHTINPGALVDGELTSPVAYTVADGRVVLDPQGVYPGPKT